MNKFIFIVLMMISFVSFTSCTNDDSEYIDVNKDLCISEWRKDISLNILPYNKIEDKLWEICGQYSIITGEKL